nr:MAG TPA: hypothetical protein [Caudoviricetes sp.]
MGTVLNAYLIINSTILTAVAVFLTAEFIIDSIDSWRKHDK